MAMRKRLEVAFPSAAGIDVGASSHFVAVPPQRDDEPVREFGAFTAELEALADWLAACEVDTVAMESTGVYWIPLYELLERRGFRVYLVNARQVKNVPGRKSGVLDCQWLQQLMSYGLLEGAYRPADEVCVLRAVVRHRETLLQEQARQVQRMQKSLVQMNVQLTEVLSDVVGQTGQAIIRAIVADERDPHKLARLRHRRVKADEQSIARALQGNWRCRARSTCSCSPRRWHCSMLTRARSAAATRSSKPCCGGCSVTSVPTRRASKGQALLLLGWIVPRHQDLGGLALVGQA